MKKLLYAFSFILTALHVNAQTVVDVIINSPDHTILETAVGAAGLVETLQGDGPFTVFAPTDDAFAALPAGTIDALLADPQGALTDILLYHVIGAEVLSTDLSDGQMAATINGKDITVTINADGVFINNAKVTMADIMTDNGVVHVIDAVLLPPSVTVVDIIVNSADHTILETAVGAAGLVETLQGDGPFTVFAPTDDAFAALPAGTIDALLADPEGALTDILLYHVIGAEVLSTDLQNGQVATTVNGDDITVTINADGVFINNAKVTMADIMTDNGIVHVIDAVLLPTTATKEVQEVKSIEIVPNPAQNTIELKLDNEINDNIELLINNTTGQPVMTKRLASNRELVDITSLNSGLYVVRLKQGNRIFQGKLFVSK